MVWKTKMRATFLPCCLLILALCLPFDASSQKIGLGIKAGTTGLGADIIGSVNPSINVRLGGSYFAYSHSDIIEDEDVNIRYDAKARVFMVSAILDWYLSNSSFHLSGGVFYNGTQGDGSAVPTENYTYASRTFTPDELGSISADVGYESSIAPYVGLGFGNPVKPDKTIGFLFRLGIMYTDAPSFDMNGSGMIAPTADQDRDIEEGLRDFKWYPVLDLGISFNIF